MDGQLEDFEVLSVALKSQQWSAARRRDEALIQAEVRRLALSDRRKTSRPHDADRDQGAAMPPGRVGLTSIIGRGFVHRPRAG